MTLKQFLELCIGIGLALLIYSSNLYPIIKWPLIAAAAFLGVALAFIPIQERPLDQWIFAFVRAIYNPTKFYWDKQTQVPEIFLHQSGKKRRPLISAESINIAQKSTRLSAYFQSMSTDDEILPDDIDAETYEKLAQVNALFDETPAADLGSAQANSAQRQEIPIERVEKPSVRIRSLHKYITLETQTPVDMPLPEQVQEFPSTSPQIINTSLPKDSALKDTYIYTPDKQFPTEQLKRVDGEVLLAQPQNTTVDVDHSITADELAKQEEEIIASKIHEVSTYHLDDSSQIQKQEQVVAEESVRTNANLPFPTKPKQKNVVVGMVLDHMGKIVEHAIVEIQDELGMPVRALKTNTLGQFFASTPLQKGTYTLSVEKDGLVYEPQMLTVSDTIIDPLEIRASS
jgi:hypothetical protein